MFPADSAGQRRERVLALDHLIGMAAIDVNHVEDGSDRVDAREGLGGARGGDGADDIVASTGVEAVGGEQTVQASFGADFWFGLGQIAT